MAFTKNNTKYCYIDFLGWLISDKMDQCSFKSDSGVQTKVHKGSNESAPGLIG